MQSREVGRNLSGDGRDWQWGGGNVRGGRGEGMGKQRSAEQSAIEHGGDSAPVGGARLRPMQEVIRNSPRLKNTRRKKVGGGAFMADPPASKDRVMANRSKDRRKSQTPKSKSNAKVEKHTREKNVVKDEDSEESNIDDRQNDENEEDEDEMDSDDVEEESGQEEVLGEGMYEVEAIRKKRIRKVHQFLHNLQSSGIKKSATHFVQPADTSLLSWSPFVFLALL